MVIPLWHKNLEEIGVSRKAISTVKILSEYTGVEPEMLITNILVDRADKIFDLLDCMRVCFGVDGEQ